MDLQSMSDVELATAARSSGNTAARDALITALQLACAGDCAAVCGAGVWV